MLNCQEFDTHARAALAGLCLVWTQASAAAPLSVTLAPTEQLKRLQPVRVIKPIRPPQLCKVPVTTQPSQIDPDRSLFVHDEATLDPARFSLDKTLGQLVAQAGIPGTTALDLFEQFWDTQNDGGSGVGLGPNCDDQAALDGTPGINGFPIQCPRNEGIQAAGVGLDTPSDFLAAYRPISLVNRLDLAAADWSNCGEYRIVYGLNGNALSGSHGRNLIIFEAVLPNPKPGCKAGCRPVVEFWKSLSTASFDAPPDRAVALEGFFYTGLPGFRPVVHIDHYSFGISNGYGSVSGGQVRTNQFMRGGNLQRWMLKEFKLVRDCGGGSCSLEMVPVSVKGNPFGELFNGNQPAPYTTLAAAFQGDFLAQVPNLADDDINRFFFVNDNDHNAGQSNSQSPTENNYRSHFNAALTSLFAADLASAVSGQVDANGNPLSAVQLTNRATALSCAGCHQPGAFGLTAAGSIGAVTSPTGIRSSWPNSRGFVHTVETANGSGVFPLSTALSDVFLPARLNVMVNYLNSPVCPCKSPIVKPPVRVERPIQPLLGPPLRAVAPMADPLDLAPRPVELKARMVAQGDLFLERALRSEMVQEIVNAEPARETITGVTGRVH